MANNKVKCKRVDQFVYNDEDIIGRGQFGFVYLGTDMRSSEPVAIKQISIQRLRDDKFQTLLCNEIEALKKVRSPYIVRLIDAKMTVNNFYLVTEYCNSGDLQSLLRQRGSLTEGEVYDILWQVAQGFKELKARNLLHRDLKPANILVHNGKVKIADFGFSKTVDDYQKSLTKSTLGSPVYMSPQVIFKQPYTSKNDVWSLGICAYQLFYGEVPWDAMALIELANKIEKTPIMFHARHQIPPELKDFIIRCLRYNESDRMSWEEVFEHPVMKLSVLAQIEERAKGECHTESDDRIQTVDSPKQLSDEGTPIKEIPESPCLPINLYEDGAIQRVLRKNESTPQLQAMTARPASVLTREGEAVYTGGQRNRIISEDEIIADPNKMLRAPQGAMPPAPAAIQRGPPVPPPFTQPSQRVQAPKPPQPAMPAPAQAKPVQQVLPPRPQAQSSSKPVISQPIVQRPVSSGMAMGGMPLYNNRGWNPMLRI